MGVDKAWLWNVKTTDAEARKILADPGHPAFLVYAARRLATANLPREVFRDYLKKEDFLKFWPSVKRQMRKDSRNRERVVFWQGVYEYLIKDLKAKGTPFERPKAEVRVDSDQKRLGEGLRALRRSRKMTQTELAKKVELTQQHIAKIEKGITCPRSKTLEKIEKALGSAPHQYKTEEAPVFVSRVSESVTTWFTPDSGMKTESK